MCVKDTHNTWNEAIDHFTVACLVACPLNESEAILIFVLKAQF